MRSYLLFAGLTLVACRSSSNNVTDSGADGAGPVTIQQVQSSMMAPGSAVTLNSVIVTAVDMFGSKTGNFWVEEPGGGPFSGVLVYNAPVATVATLTVGTVVNITGAIKDEFALTGSDADPTGRTDTEIEPASSGSMIVTVTGTATPPAPMVVDALTYGQMYDATVVDGGGGPAFTAAWEMWGGVLITVNNVSAESAPKSFGSTVPVPPDDYDMSITGVIKAETSLAAFPPNIVRNSCIASITGVEDYFYDYLILPRNTDDVVLATDNSMCPPGETTQALCTDGIDNDANGFTDCADDNCIVAYGPGVGTCRQSTTIAALDIALPATPIQIDNAYVTAISGNGVSGPGKNFWVATSLTAAAGNGLYIYSAGTTLPITNFGVGSQVTVIGSVEDYKPTANAAGQVIRELEALQVTVSAAPGSPRPRCPG